MLNISQPPPLTLYIHLPWCIRKCPYCDFNSHGTDGRSFPEQDYIRALLRDLEFELAGLQGRRILSIFIGGGTPSLFSAAGMHHLLSGVLSRIAVHKGIEITLEANPGTVEAGRFAAYRESGINRMSLGIQSFNNAMLKNLGRIHDADDAMNAIRIAKSAGFDSLNLDLMYGLPRQQPDQAMEDLDHALSFSPGHLSWYQLTIEPNTLFYKNTPPLPSEDDLWSMQEEGGALLKAAGLRNYEISAYAREGYQCRHNLNYWEFGDYIGIGAGAHSKLTDCENGAILRTVRHRLPDRFTRLAGDAGVITERKVLTDTDIVLEFMMNALRLAGGFTHELFESRTGIPVGGIMDVLASASDKGWLDVNQTHVKPTVAGRNYLNDLLQCFMSDQDDNSDKLRKGAA